MSKSGPFAKLESVVVKSLVQKGMTWGEALAVVEMLEAVGAKIHSARLSARNVAILESVVVESLVQKGMTRGEALAVVERLEAVGAKIHEEVKHGAEDEYPVWEAEDSRHFEQCKGQHEHVDTRRDKRRHGQREVDPEKGPHFAGAAPVVGPNVTPANPGRNFVSFSNVHCQAETSRALQDGQGQGIVKSEPETREKEPVIVDRRPGRCTKIRTGIQTDEERSPSTSREDEDEDI